MDHSFRPNAMIGKLLRGCRAGDRRLAWNHAAVRTAPETISLCSPDFVADGTMPLRCAGIGVGDNISPELRWSGVTADCCELILVVEDPDAPLTRPVVHLLVHCLSPSSVGVPAGALNGESAAGIRFGRGSFGRVGYHGPRPLRRHGVHRYVFQLFAVSVSTESLVEPQVHVLLNFTNGHVLARGRLVGTFERA
jgi:Raf kinase inhibitor-like YbhB/YbcL family protein